MIEHVASSNGAFYTLFMGDADYIGDDVTAYYVSEDGTRCCCSVQATRPAVPTSSGSEHAGKSGASTRRPQLSSGASS